MMIFLSKSQKVEFIFHFLVWKKVTESHLKNNIWEYKNTLNSKITTKLLASDLAVDIFEWYEQTTISVV